MAALQNVFLYVPAPVVTPVLTNKIQFTQLPNNPSTNVPNILGNEPAAVTDGAMSGNYWAAESGLRAAWIKFDWSELMYIGRVIIYWRNPCSDFVIETYNPADTQNTGWVRAAAWYDNSATVTPKVIYREAERLRIRILNSLYDLAIYEVKIWGADPANLNIIGVTDEGSEQYPNSPAAFDGTVHMATDYNLNTFWMPRPVDASVQTDPPIVALLDLKQVYIAVGLKIWWLFYPSRQIRHSITGNPSVPEDWQLLGFRPHVSLFGLQIAEVGVDFLVKNIKMRYLQISIIANYKDLPDLQLGGGIRNIEIMMDDNVGRNLKGLPSSVWDYPLSLAFDGDPETYWAARTGQRDTYINLDLECLRNVAGLRLTFGANYPDTIAVLRWDENIGRWEERAFVAQYKSNIFELPSTDHFQTRFLRFYVKEPTEYSPHVDSGEDHMKAKLLQIYSIEVFDHRGGGGMFGLENVLTGQYSTIAYAQYQPLQWNIASDGDTRSDPNLLIQDEHKENEVGEVVQIVVTFDRLGNVALYRNGERYGSTYTSLPPIKWASSFSDTRLVFGLRSSALYEQGRLGENHPMNNYPESDIGIDESNPGDPRSPYFHGTIHRAAIIKGALLKEEVRGLYKVREGTGKELGCHCYDACPVGSNRFFPHVPVPCSGAGACRRHATGAAFAKGTCDCLPGYSGEACQYHCSEISETGCCHTTDDCPLTKKCHIASKACIDE